MSNFARLTLPNRRTRAAMTTKIHPPLTLGDALTSTDKRYHPQEVSFLQKVRQKSENVVSQLELAIQTNVRQALAVRKIFSIDESRSQQFTKIGASVPQKSEAEITAQNHLIQASFAVGLASLGSLFYPFYLAGLLCVAAPFIHHYRLAWKSLVHEKRVDANVLFIVFVAAALPSSTFFTMMIGGWFRVLANWLVVKTEDHSKQKVLDLFGQQARSVWMLVDGAETEVPMDQVQVGDLVVVYAGQMVPMDGVVMEGMASVDQHMLTGEAQLAHKEAGDQVLASTLVISGRICLQVEKAGQATVVAQIGQMLTDTSQFEETIRSRADVLNDKLALPFLLLGGIIYPFIGLDRMLGALMATPGYRMVLFGPLNMLGYLHIAAQQGILIKDGRSLEQLHKVDTVVFDKTGTLTMEQPTVHHIYTCNSYGEDDVLSYAAVAESKQSHPIARAILQAAGEKEILLAEIDDSQYVAGYGIEVVVQEQKIWVGSHRFMEMKGISVPPKIEKLQADCHEIGNSLVMVAVDDRLAGAIELQPTIRPEAEMIVAKLRARGLALYIISGDHDAPTRRLSDALGMDGYFAEVLPEDKANLVKQLQDEGHSVCFIGDGINDSIALKQADVSLSLCGSTTVAIDTAQIVLMDENLKQLPRLFTITDEFNANMNTCFLAATIPNFLIVGGAIFLGWGFMTCTLLVQLSMPFVFYKTLRPLLAEQHTEN